MENRALKKRLYFNRFRLQTTTLKLHTKNRKSEITSDPDDKKSF